MDYAFLGRGWSFPPTFRRKGAEVAMLEGEADIASSLEILLRTRQGERVMQPEYGCNLDELMFETLDTRIKTLMADKIESAILYHEPRIQVEKIHLYENNKYEGVVFIEIVYRVKSTNSRFNFVSPYYKDEGTDIGLTKNVRILPDKL
jgi:uncharacterized protein